MKTIVYHHNDADGRASAAIVGNALWDEPVIFVECDYKDRFNFGTVEAGDRVVIVDFSFKPEDMAQIMARTSNVIWCDHHKTAAAYGYAVPGVRDFSEKGAAGCEVTWQHFHPSEKCPYWITLLGDYDAWRLKEAPECLQFYEGLKLCDQSPRTGIWRDLLNGSRSISEALQAGRIAIVYRDMYCAEIRKSFGYETEIGGHRAYALNAFRFGSPGFGEAFAQYPVCIAYIHNGKCFTVSLYSETVDVGEIAKNHGGGGHKGAAGFVCEILPFVPTVT